MGGRGSAGGTRSTYRGTSTADFAARGLDANGKSFFNGNGGGGSQGGGASTKNGGGSASTNTGGIQTGGGGGGGSGEVVVEDKKTTDINDTSLPPDKDLESLFQASPEFKTFDRRNQNASPEVYQKRYEEALARFIGSWTEPKPESKPRSNIPFRRKAVTDFSTEEKLKADLETVNRNHGRTEYRDDYGINCQRCVTAVEYRYRGYDVKAAPATKGYKKEVWDEATGAYKEGYQYGATAGEIADLWQTEDGTTAQWDYLTYADMEQGRAVSAMERTIMSWGEGARGFVLVSWDEEHGGNSHIFNVEVRDGKPYYIDGQTNEAGEELEDWKGQIDASNWRGVMRVDNLEPKVIGTSLVRANSWVEERGNEEINAPSKTEAISQLNSLYPLGPGNTDKRNAFFSAWSQVYRGVEDPQPLPVHASDPELLAAFNQGLAFARRPD